MIMGAGLRKLALTAHVTSSVGSLGAVAAFLTLAVAGLISADAQMMRSVYLVMELIAQSVIVPLVIASLVAGLIQSLGTTWGLFRHYWVLTKFLLSVTVAIVLLLQLQPISYIAGIAEHTMMSGADFLGLRTSLVVHATGGFLFLLVAATLSVYKPQGMTRYGWRKQYD
jgi:hypothetical protein